MKLAFFTDTFLPQVNGVTKTLDKLTAYCEQWNINYKVFAPADKQGINDYREEKVSRLSSCNFFLYPECKLAVPNYFKIKKELDQYQPDLIHLVTPFNLGLCGLGYARKSNIPLVASYHTNFTHYLDYYNLEFLENLFWNFFRWIHNFSQLNLCPSQATKEKLAEQEITNLEIWGRGINPDRFNPSFYEQRIKKKYGLENKLVLLYVGRLAREKNLTLLIESLKDLNSNYQQKIELVITGDGPLREQLEANSPSNVTFTGYLSGEELSQMYATADIFTFPSVTETYGNVVLEAMASGLPVVGILKGGVKENLVDQYNGLACQQNSKQEFKRKLEKLIRDDHLRRKLAANAYQHARDNSWQQVFNRLFANYRQVIGSEEKKIVV